MATTSGNTKSGYGSFWLFAWVGSITLVLTMSGLAVARDTDVFGGLGKTSNDSFELARHDDSALAFQDSTTTVGNLFATGARMVESDLDRATEIAISPVELANMRDAPARIELKKVPTGDGHVEDFIIEPFDIFSEEAQVLAYDGYEHRHVERPSILLYRGVAVTDPSSDIFLSVVNDEEIWMLVRSPSKAAYICPTATGIGPKQHMLVERSSLAGRYTGTFCSVDKLHQSSGVVDRFLNLPDAPMAGFDQPLQAEIMIDINHGLFTNEFGGDADAAATYAANLFAASSAIYSRDVAICLTVSHMVVWTGPDPFEAYDSEGQLNAYTNYCQQNRGGVQRDLGHLLADLDGAGGIAWIDQLCSEYLGYAVSNLDLDATFPVQGYAWDINCITHEMGHNFGSEHTHCYDPPIDCCYANECGCVQQDQLGTVMSYCHLGSMGTDMHFHPRVAQVIRAGALSSICMSPGCGGVAVCGNGICEDNEQQTCPTDCTECTDVDQDGVCDDVDNCPGVYNPDQADADVNGIGDACEGSDDDYEENDDETQAAAIQPGTYQLQGLDDDFFYFHVAEAGDVTVEITGPTGDLDLGVFDSSGTLLSESVGPDSNESVQVAVDAGDVYVLVRPYNGMTSSYSLSITVEGGTPPPPPSDDLFEENDTPEQAAAIQPGQHQLEGMDEDWFLVSVREPSDVTVRIAGPEGDLDLGIYDTQLTLLVASAGENTSNESVDVSVQPGDLFIRVIPFNGMTSSYSLSLTVEGGTTPPPPPAEDDRYEQNNTVEQAAAIQPGTYRLQGLDPDWFRFTVAEESNVVVSITGPSGDLDLQVFDGMGQPVGQSMGPGSSERVEATVVQGEMVVFVEPYNDETTSYTMTLSLESSNNDHGDGHDGGFCGAGAPVGLIASFGGLMGFLPLRRRTT